MMKSKKQIVAGLLATSMVFGTILSPALPVYASNNYGDDVTITFNTGDGPTVALHDSTWGDLTPGVDTNDNSTLALLSGKSGYLLTDSSNLVSSQLNPTEQPSGLLERPKLPDWSGAVLDSSWDGYIFDGWYTKEGTKLERLRPAFPYDDETYYSKWSGNPSTLYDFDVKHYANLTKAGGTVVELEFLHGASAQSVPAGTPVSTSYKRTIQGYKFEGTALETDYDFQPRNARKYGEASGAGTGKPAGTFNSSHVFTGSMPNDDLLVSYQYVPDPDKKFNFRVEHKNTASTAIASAQTTPKAVGETISSVPLSISGYTVSGATITNGDNDNLSGNGTYGVTTAGGTFTGANLENFSGVMPNQPVTITYTYDVDSTAQSAVIVSYVDDLGNDLVDQGIINEDTVYTVPLGSTVTVPVPNLTGSGYMSGTNPTWTNLDTPVYTPALNQITFQTLTGSGTINIQYVVNHSDTNNWARLTLLSGANGALVGNSSPQFLPKDSVYQINADGTTTPDITGGFVPTPVSPYYMGDGWYKVGNGGAPTGSKLTSLTLENDMKIIYCFVEDSSQWIDIKFAAGAHGTISTNAVQHLQMGTQWNTSGVLIPSATAASGYLFTGWYDEFGTLAWDGQGARPATAFVSNTYTARFAPINQETGHDKMNRPDADGSLAADGSGTITVVHPADNRRYVVTDLDGTVLAEKTTAQINGGGKYTGLTPGSSYNVYEVSVSAPVLTIGVSTIEDVTSEFRSYPTRVMIPAAGDNISVTIDPANDGRARIIIRPAADQTVYALLDESGNVVVDWTVPGGSPREVIFDDLDPDTTYIVVAKGLTESVAAEDKKSNGTNVHTDIGTIAADEYVLRILGGTIDSIDGIAEGSSEAVIHAGSSVRITDDSGREFKEWKILLGSISGFTIPSQKTRNIIMPAENVVLAATYKDDTLATPSDAAIEYRVNSGHQGEVALDLSFDKVEDIRAAVTMAEDYTLLGSGRNVTYRVSFTKRQAVASSSNAAKAERLQYDDAFKAAFALDVELLRFVDGFSRSVADGTDPGPLDILIQIDSGDMGHLDYQLWQILDNGQAVEITPLDPDPNMDSQYGGFFLFTGEIDATYLLTYSKTNKVTLEDTKAGNHAEFKVRHGEGLEDCDDYDSWIPVDPYTDSDGTVWNYVGLSTKKNRYVEVSDTDEIKKNTTIYTYYETDDLDWNKAKEKLIEEIDTAGALTNNGSVSQENKDKLADAIQDAENVLNKSPKPTTDELIEAYEKLKEIVDSIRNSNGNGDGDGDGGDDNKGNHKGGGGGGGGGTIKVNLSQKNHPTYTSGTDGSWELVDAQNHSWVFNLTAGKRVSNTWAYVKYVYEGTTVSYLYHFDAEGIMNYGWFLDSDGRWYYLSTAHDGWFGHMKTGWHLDPNDHRWYYLESVDGHMLTGWRELSGQWYYFNQEEAAQTWAFNPAHTQWEYLGTNYRPYGSMYIGEDTPDGYRVGSNGALTE